MKQEGCEYSESGTGLLDSVYDEYNDILGCAHSIEGLLDLIYDEFIEKDKTIRAEQNPFYEKALLENKIDYLEKERSVNYWYNKQILSEKEKEK